MKMRRCPVCYTYTFKEVCPKCGAKTEIPLPPKYSPVDRFGVWRRKLKKELEEKHNKF